MTTNPLVSSSWTLRLQPHRTTHAPPKGPRVVGVTFRAPADWPREKAVTFERTERALAAIPRLRHLSVMPPGTMFLLTRPTARSVSSLVH